jgi:predicted TIM-barrel fold metal-dependent hydrolase
MSTLLERGRRGETLADLGIIDMHGHLGRQTFGVPDLSAESLVAAMDRIGVTSIVVSHTHCLTPGWSDANEQVLAAMREFPGRILGYVRLWPSSAEDVRREAERYLNQGFTGVKLHNSVGFGYVSSAYEPALAMANERRLPVLLHTWGRAEELGHARALAARYPEATFVLAHSGVNGSESIYGQIAREFGNVVLDLCMSITLRGMVERLVAAAGVDRIVWGSDATFLSMAHQIGKVLGADLSDEVKRKLLSGNAQRILGRIQR